jgi:uncharacterized protein with PQ loop repeat
MATWTNIKCGNCGYSFTDGYQVGSKSLLGVSRLKCKKCSTINITNSKPYSKFNSSQLITFWIGRVLRALLFGFMYGSFAGMGISELFGLSSDPIIIVFAVIGIVIHCIISYYNIKYQIDEIEKLELAFETPEMETIRLNTVAEKKLSRVENLKEKIQEIYPGFDSKTSYDFFESESNYNELNKIKTEYLNQFTILTWPTEKMCIDDDNKIYFEHIALYIKKEDKDRFKKDRLGFDGPVFIQEDLVFNEKGNLMLWGYFQHSKTELLLKQAKENFLKKDVKYDADTPYFVL